MKSGEALPKKNLMIVELNEFDPDFLASMAQIIGLPHLQQALSYPRSTTSTSDVQEHQGLDPWVQWVGIHCGKPTESHGVRRLGATRLQTSPQIWHAVADQGYTWGVWGAMNAPMGNHSGACFFMPDPWSFEENAYPAYLNNLLALPRYAAQNYLKIGYRRAFVAALRFARFFAPPDHWGLLAQFGRDFAKALISNGPNVHTFTTLLDYLGVLCFVRLRRTLRPNLSLIFLNHIAHLQHQFWLPGTKPHPEMELGLKLADVMLGLLLAERNEGEAFILMNGLKQKNVSGKQFFVYRQTNPQQALEAIGVKRGRVEQCMTHDATILFTRKDDADRAFELLESSYLSDGHKAFYVERQTDTRLFYQLAFEHCVAADTKLVCGGYNTLFYEVFEPVCERTGAHVPEGDVFHDGIQMPAHMQNHEVFHHVLSYFRNDKRVPDRVSFRQQQAVSARADVRLLSSS